MKRREAVFAEQLADAQRRSDTRYETLLRTLADSHRQQMLAIAKVQAEVISRSPVVKAATVRKAVRAKGRNVTKSA